MNIEEKVLAIFNILEDVYGYSPWSIEQIIKDIKSPESDYFFVYHNSEMVGFLSLQRLMGEIEITNLAVMRAYQGKSFGKFLLNQLDTEIEPIFLEVRASNDVAKGLYKRARFQEVGRRKSYYHNPVEDAIIMKRD